MIVSMVARRPSIRIKGKKIDVRWREVAGPGPQVYIPFDRPPNVETTEQALEVPEVRRAFQVISGAGCDISKEVALAAIYGVDLQDVRQVAKEQREARRLRSMPTVSEFVEPYMEHISADDRTTTGTRERYRSHLRIAWLPKIGDLHLDEVTPAIIDKVMDSMSVCKCKDGQWYFWCERRKANKGKRPGEQHEPGIEKTTRDRYHSAISGMFTFAVTDGAIPSSPVARARYRPRPLSQYSTKAREEKHFYLTEKQFDLLRSRFPERMQLILRLWGETGMRFSEITGLVPVQLKRASGGVPGIELNEVVKYSKELGYYRGIPKSKSARFISLDESTFSLLKEQAAKCKSGSDLIFTTADGFRITANNFRRDVWNPSVAAAMRCPEHPPTGQVSAVSLADLVGPTCGDNGGLNARRKPCGFRVVAGTDRCYAHQGLARDTVSDCGCAELDPPLRLPRGLTPHDLRHTYNSWMQAWGTHPYQMSKRLGNSVTVNAVVYGGVPDETEIALAKLSVRPATPGAGSETRSS